MGDEWFKNATTSCEFSVRLPRHDEVSQVLVASAAIAPRCRPVLKLHVYFYNHRVDISADNIL